MQIHNRLAEIRKKRGISATALAEQADVRRQTIYAIEAGTYIPNTLVSLRLAHVLEVPVEDLFSLGEDRTRRPSVQDVEMLSIYDAPQKGQPVRLCRVGNKMVGVPSQPFLQTLPLADGAFGKSTGTDRATVYPFDPDDDAVKRLLIAGCDPAVSILGQFLSRESGVELITASCSSLQAIKWLKDEKVHIAGSHLRDHRTGESNISIVKKWFPKGDCKIVTFAQWEQGLVVAKGNPREIKSVGDLARKNVKMINREKGSGSRVLLDELLKKSDIDATKICGYSQVAPGHLPAASQVYSGQADCCMATRAAARVYNLDFISLTTERYDLILREQMLDMRSIQSLLDILNRSAFQQELATLANYDMTQSGRVLV